MEKADESYSVWNEAFISIAWRSIWIIYKDHLISRNMKL